MHFAVPKNAPMTWKPNSKPGRQLAKKLKRMPPLSKVFARGFKPLKML
jgi:hypothetical protein